jgi:hypothetical protein
VTTTVAVGAAAGLEEEQPELVNNPIVNTIDTERETNLATCIKQLHYPLFVKSVPYNTKLPKKKQNSLRQLLEDFQYLFLAQWSKKATSRYRERNILKTCCGA